MRTYHIDHRAYGLSCSLSYWQQSTKYCRPRHYTWSGRNDAAYTEPRRNNHWQVRRGCLRMTLMSTSPNDGANRYLKHSFIQITFRRTGRGCDGLASECLSYRLRTNRPGRRAVVAPFAKAAIGGASHAQPRVGLAPDVTRRVLLHCLNGRGANLSAANCQPWRSRPLGGRSGRTTRRSR